MHTSNFPKTDIVLTQRYSNLMTVEKHQYLSTNPQDFLLFKF